jgi:isoleucyl-tRNA synthetase
MTKKAEAQIVREIHKFLLSGLLYKGVKPVMWSVVEKTALAEAEIEYQDHKSTTLWVKFPVIKSPNKALEGASIVIWTTTPWTIPANRAIAYGDFKYTIIDMPECGKVVVASDLIQDFLMKVRKPPEGHPPEATYEKIDIIHGQDLEGTICAHPFRGRTGSEGYFDYDVPLYHGDFVTTDAGTGFVHIAPGHGEDDFNLGQKYKIKFDETVGDDGRYLPNVKGFAGLYVYKPDGKVGEANGAVIKALLEANALLAKQNITHSYPHSWRSKAPLIFRTTPQWFIAMDRGFAPADAGASPDKPEKTLRELALKAIEDTDWYPAIGENRIRGMIEGRPDWCISRQRAWGVPIALFVDKKSGQPLKDKAVLDRISRAFDEEGADAWYSHKPQDFLGSAHKAEDFIQVFDIVDVWFESGSTHSFCLSHETGASEWPNLRWPASLYLEGSDQHRGWFHSSLLEACGTLGRAPFEAVLTHGFTLDEQGRKMSKSLGNVTAPQEVYNQMGADILRLWVLSANYTEDQRIGPEILKQTGELYRRFRNTLRYLLGALEGMNASEHVKTDEMPELERWVLHRLYEVDAVIRANVKKFDFGPVLTELHNFCNGDLSAFYVDIRKDSLYCDRPDSLRRRAARTVMEQVFNYLVLWLAPILCFTAEEAWLMRNGGESSVHLHTFPEVPKAWQDDKLNRWSKQGYVRFLRLAITGAIESDRAAKRLGSSLEAYPVVYVTPKFKKYLEGIDLKEVCIVSDITLVENESGFREGVPSSFGDPEFDVGVVIKQAKDKGLKCERCWQVLPEVGSHADHPGLCNRCRDAVVHLRKEAA